MMVCVIDERWVRLWLPVREWVDCVDWRPDVEQSADVIKQEVDKREKEKGGDRIQGMKGISLVSESMLGMTPVSECGNAMSNPCL